MLQADATIHQVEPDAGRYLIRATEKSVHLQQGKQTPYEIAMTPADPA
jgi:hypothetical protein